MNYELDEFLNYYDKESYVFMPNEIFDDLFAKFNELKQVNDDQENKDEFIRLSNGKQRKKRGKNKGINITHVAFCYTYYFLITWLYRYGKHIVNKVPIDNSRIKEILGYSADTKELNYIIKKNGLLDQIEYTRTTNDYVYWWTFSEDEGLQFETIQEHIRQLKEDNVIHTKQEAVQYNIIPDVPKKFTVKYPVKAFHRYVDDEEMKEEYEKTGYIDGTFYEVENTHIVQFEVFMYCMQNQQIGILGFYLYSFISRMNDKYGGGWDASFEKLIGATKMPESTLKKYIDILRKYKMITVVHNQEFFCLILDPRDRKANTYTANNYDLFTDKPTEYKKMEIISVKDYNEMLEEFAADQCEITLEELPY